MLNTFPHPATLRLLRYQATAQLARTLASFRGPRRLMLSLVAVLLALVWAGQVLLGLLFRQPADPQKLAMWIPLGLLAYTLWHVLKAACRTPIEPFEWTPAERELLGAAPLQRHELVLYRLAAIILAAVAKAACFSFVMLPDLRVWAAGLIGMLLALVFVDLLRMAIEIFAYGISRKAFVRFRIAVLVTAGTCIGIAVMNSFPLPDEAMRPGVPTSVVIGLRLLTSLMDLRNGWIGWAAEAPFRVFGSVILAPAISLPWLAQSLLAVTLVAGLTKTVLWLDRFFQRHRLAAERKEFQQLRAGPASTRNTDDGAKPSAWVPYRGWGAGSLAWRQLWGAYHYRTSVCVALIVPGVLSCLTLLTPQSGLAMLLQIVGGLVFYSFLLLPTALKFDFRRDLERMGAIKALPASPMAVTVGQLAVPVSLCTLFQTVVLLVAMVARPYHVAWFITALILLVPTNVFVYSLENLIFLLYPYRPNQEGVGVFLRSILTFTAKSILFAVALGLAWVWAAVAREIATALIPGDDLAGPCLVFVTGISACVTAAAAGVTAMLVSVYRRFDPSQDTPALS